LDFENLAVPIPWMQSSDNQIPEENSIIVNSGELEQNQPINRIVLGNLNEIQATVDGGHDRFFNGFDSFHLFHLSNLFR
jgi:hypothetical protein